MLVLGLDTSSWQCGLGLIAVADDASPARWTRLAESTWPSDGGHAETLLGRLDRLLGDAGHRLEEVDLFACASGPGTFTGLRIGLATIKGLCLALDRPLVGVPTLLALAATAEETGRVVAVLDARRGELFTAAYDSRLVEGHAQLTTVRDPGVLTPAALAELIPELLGDEGLSLVGDGVALIAPFVPAALVPRLRCHGPRFATPSGAVVAALGLARFRASGPDDLATFEPDYLRAPDVRPPKNPIVPVS